MTKPMPALELRTNFSKYPRYFLRDKSEFTEEDCIEAIADIVKSDTFGEQKRALAVGIVGVAGQFTGLPPRGEHRATGLGISRFLITEDSVSLVSIILDQARIGFQTPNETVPNPAFAVVDVGSYHRVVKQPDEELGILETVINHEVALKLVDEVNAIRPSLEVVMRLEEDRGIHLRQY